jgi:uncharacterized protein YacL
LGHTQKEIVEKEKLTPLRNLPFYININKVLKLNLNIKLKKVITFCMKKDTEGQKKDSPIKITDESSLVDRIIELSDLKLGFIEVCDYLEEK